MLEYEISELFAGKSYYCVGPDGSFDWKGSVRNVATQLAIPDREEEVRTAIETSFTPEALTMVTMETEDGSIVEQPFIACISALGKPTYMWTEGNADWQKKKYQYCGVAEYISEDRFLTAETGKEELIGTFVAASSPDREVHCVVIDDKRTKLEKAEGIVRQLEKSHVHIHPFQLLIGTPDADPTTVYKKIKERIQSLAEDAEIAFFVDMDGVTIDTPRVMKEKAASSVASLLK